MHRNRLTLIRPFFVLLLLAISACSSRQVRKFPLACHQIGFDYDIGVDANNRVSNDPACVDKKQKIHWKRVGSDKGFRIVFLDAKTPIRPIDQACRNECRADILPEARTGEKWAYSVTDLTTGQKYDPVIIIDGCCVTTGP
jgi:hypothetical protein